MEQKRYFTIEEAETLIPELSRLLRKLSRLKQRIATVHASKSIFPELIELTDDGAFQFYFQEEVKLNAEYHRMCHQFFKGIHQLNNFGVLVKDLDDGLIDFPYEFEGRDVLLCWKLGEKKVEHWHELDTGYPGRKKIIDLEEFFEH